METTETVLGARTKHLHLCTATLLLLLSDPQSPFSRVQWHQVLPNKGSYTRYKHEKGIHELTAIIWGTEEKQEKRLNPHR